MTCAFSHSFFSRINSSLIKKSHFKSLVNMLVGLSICCPGMVHTSCGSEAVLCEAHCEYWKPSQVLSDLQNPQLQLHYLTEK